MNEDRGHGAMPKLYGAPAYARPPALPVDPVDKPFDPDDLPLEAERTNEDAELLEQLTSRTYESVATTAVAAADPAPSSRLRGRPSPLRIRILGRGQDGR